MTGRVPRHPYVGPDVGDHHRPALGDHDAAQRRRNRHRRGARPLLRQAEPPTNSGEGWYAWMDGVLMIVEPGSIRWPPLC